MLRNILLLDLMAVAPLLIGAEEEKEVVGDILAATTTSAIGSLTVATMGVPPGIVTVVMVAIGNSRNQQGRTNGHDRLDANFVARLGTLHSNVHNLCIIGIKPRPTSPLMKLQQQILSLGFLTQVRINMLLQTLSI
jgi:hypothetical protein